MEKGVPPISAEECGVLEGCPIWRERCKEAVHFHVAIVCLGRVWGHREIGGPRPPNKEHPTRWIDRHPKYIVHIETPEHGRPEEFA